MWEGHEHGQLLMPQLVEDHRRWDPGLGSSSVWISTAPSHIFLFSLLGRGKKSIVVRSGWSGQSPEQPGLTWELARLWAGGWTEFPWAPVQLELSCNPKGQFFSCESSGRVSHLFKVMLCDAKCCKGNLQSPVFGVFLRTFPLFMKVNFSLYFN